MTRISKRLIVLTLAAGLIALLPVVSAGASDNGPAATFTRGEHRVLPFQSVLPTLPTAILPNSRENTTAVAQNSGTNTATIQMDIYTPGGIFVSSASVTYTGVPVGGSRTFQQASNTGLSQGFRGVGVISSDQPLSAVLVREITSTVNGKKSYSVHNAYPSGANTVSLPYISNALDATYNTRFAIANTGTAIACVSVAYAFVPGAGSVPASGKATFTDTGTGGSGCASGYPIAVGGQLTFAPDSVDGQTPMPSQTRNALMAATVTSTGSPVTVAVDAYHSDGTKNLASYDGFVVNPASPTTQDVSTTVAIPLALRLDGFYSQILVANPNSSAATATITYTDQTSRRTFAVGLSVPANGTANHSVFADSVVPEGFLGSAVVTSNQPLAAVVFRSHYNSRTGIDDDLYTAANGVPSSRASTTARFPLIVRRLGRTGGLDGQNTWVNVGVIGGGTATVTITATADTVTAPGACASAASYSTTKVVNGSFYFYQNAANGSGTENGFGQDPTCFYGSMTITSTAPFLAIAASTSDLFSGDLDGTYNALTP